ncbi:MAG TPA: response regulator [Verrucomicrobiae bacterium]|nr:response regulator [Verrucomicrobiae bacterium]
MPDLILLAEDSPFDAFHFKRVLKAVGVFNPVHVATDGYQAIAYIAGEGFYADRERFPEPGILFLDLIMPRADGWFVLNWLNTKRERFNLLTIVLTGIAQSNQLRDAYSLSAHSFMYKPLKPAELKGLINYWPDRWLLKEPPANRPGLPRRPQARNIIRRDPDFH